MKYTWIILLFLLFKTQNCMAGWFDDFDYGALSCPTAEGVKLTGSHECLEIKVKFRTKEDCEEYILLAYNSRCLGGNYLEEAKTDEPVCWKGKAELGFGVCVKL